VPENRRDKEKTPGKKKGPFVFFQMGQPKTEFLTREKGKRPSRGGLRNRDKRGGKTQVKIIWGNPTGVQKSVLEPGKTS